MARLPAEKLKALQELIASWLARTWCNRQELESLIGHLHHAVKVVWPGQTFCVRWLICCAASARRTILSALIRSFTAICNGGTSFWSNGTALASGFSRGIHLQQILKFPLTRQVPWALALMWRDSGFLVHGGPHSQNSPSHIRNFFPWSSLLISRAISGAGSMFCFARTIIVWSTSCFLRLPKYHPSCICYVPCYWQPPVIVSLSLPNMFQESLTQLLTLFPAFIGRIFTIWLQKHILIPPLVHHSCWRTSSLHFRSTVLFLFDSGPSSIYLQILRYTSVPVYFLLPPVGQDPFVWVSLPSWWMDTRLVHYLSGTFPAACLNQSVPLRC